MAEDHILQYAKSIIAVASGKESTYFKEDIALCKSILSLLRIGNMSQASAKIEEVFKKTKLKYESDAPRHISNKIIELLGL